MCLASASRALLACLLVMFFTYVSDPVTSFLWHSQCSICFSSTPRSRQKCFRCGSSPCKCSTPEKAHPDKPAPCALESPILDSETAFTYWYVTGISISLWADLNIAQVKDGGDDFKDGHLTAVLYPWNFRHIEAERWICFPRCEQEDGKQIHNTWKKRTLPLCWEWLLSLLYYF